MFVKSPTYTPSNNQKNNGFALISLTALFFMWGFITCLNDILIPYLKGIFNLTYTESMLVQFCFFGAYFLVSLPSGKLVKKLGYQKGIVTGLVVAAIGCLMFYPAADLNSYPVFLLALFILASGITLLQVSANPYVTLLGPANTASVRLTITQAFNSVGTTIAPYFGALLILGGGAHAATTSSDSVQTPYLLLTAILLILAAIFAFINLPKTIDENNPEPSIQKGSAWQYSHLKLGAIGIFLYVGAEVAIGSFLVSFLGEISIAGLAESEAANYLSYFWGGAMVGRFIGAAVMQKFDAGLTLFLAAVCATFLMLITVLTSGHLAMWAIILVGLFNSIMFPTIFSLALQELNEHTSQGSGILCLAIVGGAIVPLLQGALADLLGVQLAFVIPILCYLYIAYYGLIGSKTKN